MVSASTKRKRKENLMMPRKLPSDMEEEILIRVPPLSLVRLRCVCKAWYMLFKDQRFANKNVAYSRPEIMLITHSNIYTITVHLNSDPTIEFRDLCFDLRGSRYWHHGNCDGFFFMSKELKGNIFDESRLAYRFLVVLNPVLRQARLIADSKGLCGTSMGYDGSKPEKSYKIIGSLDLPRRNEIIYQFKVFKFATNKWEYADHTVLGERIIIGEPPSVSLNGNLYWTAHDTKTGQYLIQILDFSKEIEMKEIVPKPFCNLPCKEKKPTTHTRVLAVYKRDRFSLLEQCKRTRKFEIWVTKNKIGNGDYVVWIKFMTVSIPNFPMFHQSSCTSYFVDDNIYGKSCVICFLIKKPKQAWVYIVRGDQCKKIKIDEVKCEFQSSVYVPSLITIPSA